MIGETCTVVSTSTMSSVGSLTSTFTPAPFCLHDLYYDDDYGDMHLDPDMHEECYPGSIPTYARDIFKTYFYYSPAVCPSGYTSACGETCLSDRLPASETGMKCCPSNYSCKPGYNFCTSSVSTAIAVTLTNPQVVTTVSASSRTAFALPFIVRYQESDQVFLGIAPKTDAPKANQAEETGSASTDEASSEAGGLAPGAKIAIGVIIPVVVIIIALVVLCLCLKKKRKVVDETPTPAGPWGKPELDSSEVELTQQRIYDAKGPIKVPNEYELPDSTVYYEMDSQPAGGHRY